MMVAAWIKYFIEIMFGLSMFVNALLFIPQAIKLWQTKNTKGVSLLTFAGFNLIQLFTILHAYLNKDFILMFGFMLSLVLCGIVTTLIVFYKTHERRNI